MNKRILGGLLCAAMLCAAPALAMPGMGEVGINGRRASSS